MEKINNYNNVKLKQITEKENNIITEVILIARFHNWTKLEQKILLSLSHGQVMCSLPTLVYLVFSLTQLLMGDYICLCLK